MIINTNRKKYSKAIEKAKLKSYLKRNSKRTKHYIDNWKKEHPSNSIIILPPSKKALDPNHFQIKSKR